MNSLLMRLWSKLGQNSYGFDWLQLSQQKTSKFSHYPYPKKERNMSVADERFLSKIVHAYGNHAGISTDDGGTWYPPACRFLNLPHHLHSPFEKSLIERTMQYIKDRTTESFDDYFPCKRKKCKLKYVKNWLNLFAYHYNKKRLS